MGYVNSLEGIQWAFLSTLPTCITWNLSRSGNVDFQAMTCCNNGLDIGWFSSVKRRDTESLDVPGIYWMVSKWVITYFDLLIHGIYWGYNLPTNFLLTGTSKWGGGGSGWFYRRERILWKLNRLPSLKLTAKNNLKTGRKPPKGSRIVFLVRAISLGEYVSRNWFLVVFFWFYGQLAPL